MCRVGTKMGNVGITTSGWNAYERDIHVDSLHNVCVVINLTKPYIQHKKKNMHLSYNFRKLV